jgi:DMSO/TMAO reductase YedYZ molybdopterin-dependent catalytic subunit
MALGTPGRRIRTLPPGQRAIDYFPRFGTGLDKPSPAPAADPVIDVAVGGDAVARVAVSDLLAMRRTTVRADFHCVAGWTATDLRWEGVRFSDFLDAVVSAGHPYRRSTSHAQFAGSDGFTSVACLKDVLAEDVLIADHLDGDPLPLDHGAPVRLVSPHQYGYISTKHLCATNQRKVDRLDSAGTGEAS